jgi:hypothetical protein
MDWQVFGQREYNNTGKQINGGRGNLANRNMIKGRRESAGLFYWAIIHAMNGFTPYLMRPKAALYTKSCI